MPDCFGATVVTNSYVSLFYTRGCGCVGHPAFPTPFGAERKFHNSGRSCRGEAEVCLIALLRGADATNQSSLLSWFASLALAMTRPSTPADNLRHLGRGRGVAAALGTHDAVDDGHADTWQITEANAVEQGLAGRMLRLVHQNEIRRAADLDQSAIELTHPRGVAGGKTEGDFGRQFAERGQ